MKRFTDMGDVEAIHPINPKTVWRPVKRNARNWLPLAALQICAVDPWRHRNIRFSSPWGTFPGQDSLHGPWVMTSCRQNQLTLFSKTFPGQWQLQALMLDQSLQRNSKLGGFIRQKRHQVRNCALLWSSKSLKIAECGCFAAAKCTGIYPPKQHEYGGFA